MEKIETKEWRFDDIKVKMPPGEWQDEPDKAQWQDEETGLHCLIVRNDFGNLCGYVGVDKSSKFYEKEYSECLEKNKDCEYKYCDHTPESLLECHGGLTFSSFCAEGDEEYRSVCHVAKDKVWWLGFDCGHAWDLSPAMKQYFSNEMLEIEKNIGIDKKFSQENGFPFLRDIYRNFNYVKNEVTKLAKQIREKT